MQFLPDGGVCAPPHPGDDKSTLDVFVYKTSSKSIQRRQKALDDGVAPSVKINGTLLGTFHLLSEGGWVNNEGVYEKFTWS